MEQFQQILVPALIFVAIMTIGGSVLAARSARAKALAPRLFDHDAIPDEHGGVLEQPRAGVSLVNRIGSAATLGQTSEKLGQQLTRAGFHARNAPEVYLGVKILLLAVGGLATAAVVIPLELPILIKALAVVVVGAMLSFIPNVVVSLRRRARSTEVRRHLPDATDLLEICVCAGMGLDMAWNVVADEVRGVSTVLADEMALTNLEIQLNAPRPVAMRHMADRTGAPELLSLVAVLIQSERFGTSIADALRMFASSLREERSQRAEESAEKMSVKLILPMVVFIFPAAFIVMVGPAALKLSTVMSGGH
jgi:tight adherence protein C